MSNSGKPEFDRGSGNPEAESAAIELIGVGIGLHRPRPPNRTGGFLAYGSPVGGFFIETVSLIARPCEARTARHSRRRHWAIVDGRLDRFRRPGGVPACATWLAGAAGSSGRVRGRCSDRRA